MAGLHVNDGQARQYMRHRKDGLAVETAAAKAGFSRATGYRLEADRRLPSEKRKPRGSRRPDPLGGLFERVAPPLLGRNPKLRAVAVFEELRRLHPELPASTRRTVERRVREWKALHGPEREVVFVQKHRPGRRGQTRRYEALCAHYRMTPTRNNRGAVRTRTAWSRAATATSSGRSPTR